MRIGLLASVGKHLDSFFPEIATEFRRRGHEVVAAAGTVTTKMNASLIPGLTQSPSLSNWQVPRRLREWSTANRVDVLLTNTATSSALARLLKTDIPVAYFCHGLHWNEGNAPSEKVWQVAERLLLRNTAGIVTINSDDQDWFEKNAPSIPLLRLPSGVGVPKEYHLRTVPPPDRLRKEMVWVGDFSPRKRPELAVELTSALKQSNYDCHLTMVGDGPLLEATRRLVEQRQLTGFVSLTGRAPSARTFIDASNCVVHTSKWEGLPRVLLEGASRNRPIFAFNVKGVRDIPGAHLANDGDVNGLASLIVSRLGESAQPKDRYQIETSEEVAARLLPFLQDLSSLGANQRG